MTSFSLLDHGIIVAYFVIFVSLGIFFKRRSEKTISTFFLGGRKLPWWALGVSGMASFFDLSGTMLIVSFLYLLGPQGLYIEFRGGVALVLAFMMIVTGKWHYRSRCMTGAEWMEFRFGSGAGGQAARLASALALIVTTIGMLAYLIKGLGLFASMFLPFAPSTVALIMISIAALYVIFSGFYGIVYTDIFQSSLLVAAAIIVSLLAFAGVGSTPSFHDLARSVTHNPDWTFSIPQTHAALPTDYAVYKNVSMFAFFYFIRNALIGLSSAGADPKYFGARSEKDCGRLTMLWTFLMSVRWPFMMGFAVLGILFVSQAMPSGQSVLDISLYLRTHIANLTRDNWQDALSTLSNAPSSYPKETIDFLQAHLGGGWQTRIHLISFDGTVNPEMIVPSILLSTFSPGLRGFLFVALIAAAFSSFNTTVNVAAANFTRDIYQRRFRPSANETELLFASYAFIAGITLVGYALAFHFENITHIWGWIMMGLGGGLAIPSALRFFWWRYNGEGFTIGTVVGLAFAVTQGMFFPNAPEWQQFVIISIVSFTATIVGTYLTQPLPDNLVRNFYLTTRPFGLWGRIRSTIPIDVSASIRRENRTDLMSLPFALVWQVTLFFLPMQFMIRSYSSLLVTLPLCIASFLYLYFFWYRKLS